MRYWAHAAAVDYHVSVIGFKNQYPVGTQYFTLPDFWPSLQVPRSDSLENNFGRYHQFYKMG
jgi:hypothetical protein